MRPRLLRVWQRASAVLPVRESPGRRRRNLCVPLQKSSADPCRVAVAPLDKADEHFHFWRPHMATTMCGAPVADGMLLLVFTDPGPQSQSRLCNECRALLEKR